MPVADAFGWYLDRLAGRDARVVSLLNGVITRDDRDATAAALGGIPNDLLELWTVHDGTSDSGSSDAGCILPSFQLNSSRRAVERRIDRSFPEGRWDLLAGETDPLDDYGALVPVFEDAQVSLVIDLANPNEVLIFEFAREGYLSSTGLTIGELFEVACDLLDSGWIVVDTDGCVSQPTEVPGPPPDVVPDIIGYTQWPPT